MPPKEKEAIKSSVNVTAEIIGILLFLFFLSLIFSRMSDLLAQYNLATFGDLWDRFTNILKHNVWPFTEWVMLVIGMFSIVIIVKSYIGLRDINIEEKAIYHPESKHLPPSAAVAVKSGKWERIIELVNSPNASDWRLAIIEADIMLDELLRSRGYYGDSVGDMLKAVDKSDFLTLDAAWEAHKIRNEIVHGGDNFPLNEREAKHAAALYESVFKEFQII
jgi:hypothetical protein